MVLMLSIGLVATPSPQVASNLGYPLNRVLILELQSRKMMHNVRLTSSKEDIDADSIEHQTPLLSALGADHVVATSGSTIHVFRTTDMQRISSHTNSAGPVNAIEVSQNGKQIAVDANGVITVWRHGIQ